MALLQKQELQTIEAAIARAEANSAGEIVVAVVGRSGGYYLPRAICAATWTVALALIASLARPAWPTVWVILGQLPVGLAAWLFWSMPPLVRWLAGRRAVATKVRARALQMFAERGVHQTRDHSGLLIMISHLEHHVVILGDVGIHAHVTTQGWDEHVRHIVTGIRGNRLAPALVEVIDGFGTLLASKFPRRTDDVNELSNQVVQG